MKIEEIKAALDSLVEQGLLEELPNGDYRPTEAGREVVKLEQALDES